MITEGLEEDDMFFGLFLDFTKAFDSVDHDLPIRKHEIYGNRGTQLKRMSSYLHKRTQYVSINVGGKEYISPKYGVVEGVPQGINLRPILFLIYMNEMPNIVPLLCEFFINYADDTNILLRTESLRKLQDILDTATSINSWCIWNNLTLNWELLWTNTLVGMNTCTNSVNV